MSRFSHLLVGNVVGFILSIGAYPLITRLYDPSNFVYPYYVRLLGQFMVAVVTGRIYMLLSKKDLTQLDKNFILTSLRRRLKISNKYLIMICLLASLFLIGFTLLGIGNYWLIVTAISIFPFYYYFCYNVEIGIHESLSEEKYIKIRNASILGPLGSVLTRVAGYSLSGLGLIISLCADMAVRMKIYKVGNVINFNTHKKNKNIKLDNSSIEFSLDLLNQSSVVIILSFLGFHSLAGEFALCYSVVIVPALVIITSINHSVYKSLINNKKTIGVKKTFFILTIPILIALAFYVSSFYFIGWGEVIFGENYHNADEIIMILAAYASVRLFSDPLKVLIIKANELKALSFLTIYSLLAQLTLVPFFEETLLLKLIILILMIRFYLQIILALRCLKA